MAEGIVRHGALFGVLMLGMALLVGVALFASPARPSFVQISGMLSTSIGEGMTRYTLEAFNSGDIAMHCFGEVNITSNKGILLKRIRKDAGVIEAHQESRVYIDLARPAGTKAATGIACYPVG